MVKDRRQLGFSLTETLMAVGTLAIGMMFIAGTFLTGIFFSTMSTERTIAAAVVEEAFAKIQLHGLDPNQVRGGLVSYEQLVTIPREEYLYPSSRQEPQRQYSWAAICRSTAFEGRLVECTIFVCRQTTDSTYWIRKGGSASDALQLVPSDLPRPVRVMITQDATGAGTDEVVIQDAVSTDTVDERAFINDGCVLVEQESGEIFRVLERYPNQVDKIKLDHPFVNNPPASRYWMWVVPPAASGGRNPVVAVYQKVLRFPGP